jgi:site-specific DNA-methyltransferase (adenine-specific)
MSTTDPNAVMVPLSALKPWLKNPRKNAAAVEPVARSIERFGFGAPILVRRENHEIIAGHTRALAAKKLGLKEVPVRYLDLSEEDAHRLARADNKLGEVAEWDVELLLAQLQKEDATDLLAQGWDEATLQDLLNQQVDFQPVEETNTRLDVLTTVRCPHCDKEFELKR